MQKFMIFCLSLICCFGLFNSGVFAAEITPKEFEPVPADLYPSDANNKSFIYASNSNDFICVLLYNTLPAGNVSDFYKVVYKLNSNNTYDLNMYSYNDNNYMITYKYSPSKQAWQQISGPDKRPNNYSNVILSYLVALHQTDIDIYDVNTDDLVFPAPPQVVPTLEEVITEGVNNLQTETVGTMGILTIIAVGLLASLVGFLILPKVLYRFL